MDIYSEDYNDPSEYSPSFQVLNNPELARLVVEFFDSSIAGEKENHKALAALVTVNRSLFHASTDALWRSMPSISPFLRLLPAYQKEDDWLVGPIVLTVQTDAWSRFRLYSAKTTKLRLTSDITMEEQMPMHWFFFFFNQPTRPVLLFPKLKHFTVSSLAGLNSIIPFHVLPTLQTIVIPNLLHQVGVFEATRKASFTIALMTSLASSSTSLRSLTLQAPLTPQLASAWSEMTSLTELNLTLRSPSLEEDFKLLNSLPPDLKTLKLANSRYGEALHKFPPAGCHLKPGQNSPKSIPKSIWNLAFHSGGYFMFWATSHLFYISSLRTFSARLSDSLEGILLVPHLFHLVAHRNPTIEQISFEWDIPQSIRMRNHSSEHYDRWDAYEPAKIPTTLFSSISQLRYLKVLSIKNLFFIDPSFILQLVDQLPNFPSLETLCLVPNRLSNLERHKLILPSLLCLRTLSLNNPNLQHVTISLALDEIPTVEELGIRRTFPGHGLKTLFIIPPSECALSLSDVISVSTYLDHLFPRLDDMMSYFVQNAQDIAEEGALTVWRDVYRLVKSYQVLRQEVEVRAGLRK